MQKGYTTRQDVENYLLITIDPSFHAQVDKWIEAMEGFIDKSTGRDFAPPGTAAARVYDGSGVSTLAIDNASEITKVEYGGGSEWTEILVADYLKYPANSAYTNKLYLPGGVFPRGYQNIRVTAKWGATSVPAEINFAATVLVAGIINNAYSSEGEISSMTIGPYSVSYKDQEQVNDFKRVEEILQLNKKYYF